MIQSAVSQYDLSLVRRLLQAFGGPSDDGAYIKTEGLTLYPPSGFASSEANSAHIKLLLKAGLIRVTREIKMTYHPDPPTLRVTEIGRIWVRRAHVDAMWTESVSELQALLDSATEERV